MARKKKGMTRRELFKEGVYALSAHIRRAVDITRQDHPLQEVQHLCQGIDALMIAAENAADLGYSLEVVASYQPLLPGMEEATGGAYFESDPPDDSSPNLDWPF